jgi:hypothetical protein
MTIDLKNIGVTVGACVAIFTGVWFFTQAAVDNHINTKIEEYVNTKHFQKDRHDLALQVSKEVFLKFLESKNFEEVLEAYLEENNSNTVSLRHLLSIKMEVPEESVANVLADLHNKDSKRLINVLRFISRKYPDSNVWKID